jgi:hypothetical protein
MTAKPWNEQVLSTSRSPEVFYESGAAKVLKLGEGSYRIELLGKLTLNGVTRTQNVVSQVTIGPYNLRATANIAGGLLTLRHGLKFAFFIVARKDPKDSTAH